MATSTLLVMLALLTANAAVVSATPVEDRPLPAAVSVEASSELLAADVLARIDDEIITRDEYEAHVQASMRQRFYHGQVTAEQRLAFRQQMAQQLIERVLLWREALRRGLQPDASEVNTALAAALTSASAESRGQLDAAELAQLRRQLLDMLQRQSLIDQLEQQVAAAIVLSEEHAQAYYLAHAEQFTTPARVKLAVILLGVPPWAPVASWQAAEAEAQRLREILQHGEAHFSELARLHSSDSSASQGGDLGFVHQGMLSDEAQQLIDGLQPGEIGAPLKTLRGVALFRLQQRQPAVLNDYAQVKERAMKLLRREREQQAWQQLIENLRQHSVVQVNDEMIKAGN